MSSLQWKKLKVLGVDSYNTVYLAIVVDTQTPYQSFITEKSSILSGGCEEIIRCFGTKITVKHGCYFYNLLLEYAPHGSLDDLIHNKPLPETDVSVYALMIVKGFLHIHRKGIVHCNLNSENILLFPSLEKESAYYQLKIADFKLSKTKEEEAEFEVWKSKTRGPDGYAVGSLGSGRLLLFDGFAERELESGGVRK
ncbi:uncharacterized protein DS421_20g676590 [Arachis hypogaea]|nr:uncharacterized protein DS421_20g676590 [Arachis hypogaea]